jgi:hypothetical protein
MRCLLLARCDALLAAECNEQTVGARMRGHNHVHLQLVRFRLAMTNDAPS